MNKIYQLLGLAQRAGETSSGAMAVKNSLLRNRACLLIMSCDISDRTRESLVATCQKQKIPWITLGDKYGLGNAVGKAYRVAVTVNNGGMAKAMMKAVPTGDVVKTTGVVEWPK